MVPAILGAMKAANWTQRGIMAGVVVGAFAAVFAWGYIKGHASSETTRDAAILDQALDVGRHEAAKAEALAKVEETHDEKERKAEQERQVVTHEIVKYVQVAKPIELDPKYIALLDRLHRMQRDAEDRVSQADPSSHESEGVRAAQITTNQLLLAYTELVNARGKDLELIEFVKEFEERRYAAEMEFYNGLPATARAQAD